MVNGIFGKTSKRLKILWKLLQFLILTIRRVPENVVMVTIDMCGKNAITKEWIYAITWKHVYFNICVLFIVDTTSILKLVFPITYCFCFDCHLSGCVVVFINVVVAFFPVIVTVIFVIMVIITTITFVICVIFYCKYCR